MSLRKPPRRTRALLAANRRNARKSTGPRTELGKSHSAVNAVRHYRRTQFASCLPIENREIRAFEDFLFKLREAIIPADNAAGTEAVLLKAAEVWRVKRSFERWIETRTEEDWLVLAAGAVPRPRSWRLKLSRAFHKYTNVLVIAIRAHLVAWYGDRGLCHAESKSL